LGGGFDFTGLILFVHGYFLLIRGGLILFNATLDIDHAKLAFRCPDELEVELQEAP
jgi:hypothetical protein